MTDIVERLRRPLGYIRVTESQTSTTHSCDMCQEAAAEIERLRAALSRLIAWENAVDVTCPELGGLLKAMYDARKALEGKE